MAPSTKIIARVSDAADQLVTSSPTIRGWETVRRAGLLAGFATFAFEIGTGAPAFLVGLSCVALGILLRAPRREIEATASVEDVFDGWDDEEQPVSSGESRDIQPMSGVRTCAQEAAIEEAPATKATGTD